MLGQPAGDVDLARVHVGNANIVTLEKIRDHGEVAIVGELVSEELGVAEDTEDIGQEDNGLLGGLVVLGVDDIGVDWAWLVTVPGMTRYRVDALNCYLTAVDVLGLADGSTLVLEARGAAGARGVGGHFEVCIRLREWSEKNVGQPLL